MGTKPQNRFLTAEWKNLVMLPYAVEPSFVRADVPSL
jgi:hypothetical protein